jgi:DNA-binding NarL/FixJ family response regulator
LSNLMKSMMKGFYSNRPVLVIDDCQIYRTASRGMLIKLGFNPEQILVARDAATALTLCEIESFQLVLCDYNLGSKTDGHQLLDEIIHHDNLPADCAVIIVTGDSSAKVVQGFADLNSDGFLIKPINFITLQKRLPKLIQRKRMLAEALISYANSDFDNTIQLAEEAVLKAEAMTSAALRLKASALIRLNKLDEANDLLFTIQDASKNPYVQLEFARIALLQKKYTLCESLLSPLEKISIISSSALQLSAELLFKQFKFGLALEKITEAVLKSPKNIERHIFKTHIAMAQFDIETAYKSMENALVQARYSFRDTLLLHQLTAILSLDLGQFAAPEQKQNYFALFTRHCQVWRNRFQLKEYKTFELLMLARAHCFRGTLVKAKECLDEYQKKVQSEKNRNNTIIEKLELGKVFFMLNNDDGYQSVMHQIKQELNIASLSNEQQAIKLYIAGWMDRVDRIKDEVSTLKDISNQFLQKNNYEKVVENLIKAMTLNSLDEDIASKLLHCLTKAWPKGWSKKDVTRLALRCRDRLKNSSVSNSGEYKLLCETLASQLNIKELLPVLKAK